jgi:hypothetical protein
VRQWTPPANLLFGSQGKTNHCGSSASESSGIIRATARNHRPQPDPPDIGL